MPIGYDPPAGGSGGGGSAAAAKIAVMEFFGHSYGAGSGAHAPSYRYASRLARALGALETNYANAGAKIINNGPGAGQGGWTWVGVNRVPTPRAAGHEYDAPTQVINFDYGVNEFIGGTAPNQEQFKHSFRSCIHHCMASQRFSDTDPQLSYTGGFTNQTNYPDAQVGKTLRGSAAAGATVALQIAPSFPGGNIGMSFVGGLTRGARLSFTLDGVDKGQLDARDTHPVGGSFNQATKRLTDLPAGAHTMIATVDAVAPADVFFDCASIEAKTPPLMIVHGIARTPGYPGPFTTQTGWISQVVDEFGDNVIYLDIDAVLDAVVANFNPDNLHPSDRGHSLIAKAVYDLIEANVALIPGADAVLIG